MNSSIQSLAHTVPLMRKFLRKKYESDINKDNPLGMKGELATAFGNLMDKLWQVRCHYPSLQTFHLSRYSWSPACILQEQAFNLQMAVCLVCLAQKALCCANQSLTCSCLHSSRHCCICCLPCPQQSLAAAAALHTQAPSPHAYLAVHTLDTAACLSITQACQVSCALKGLQR